MKILLLFTFVTVILLLPCVCCAEPSDMSAEIRTQLEAQDFSVYQQYLDGLPESVRGIWGNDTSDELIRQYASGESNERGGTVLFGLKDIMADSLKKSIGSLTAIVGIALLSGVVNTVTDKKQGDGISEIASFVCYSLSVVILVGVFFMLAESARTTINGLSSFSQDVTPLLVTMMSSVGMVASAGMMQPLMVFLSGSVTQIMSMVVLPLIIAGSVLAIIANLTGRIQLSHLFSLSKSAIKWVIGIVFTVYLGMVSIRGMSAAGIDSVSVRTVKYTLDKSLPVIGGVVSGTFDTVQSCAVLIKNASGIVSVLIAAGYVALPLIRILASAFALKLCAALCEPISDDKMPRMLSGLGDMCEYLFAAVGSVALMFIITVALIAATGSAGGLF